MIYFKNISSNIFTMESKSKFQIFNNHVKVKVPKFVFIRRNCRFRIDFEGEVSLGDYVFINDNCNINCVEEIIIGDYTKIAPNVRINNHDHNYKQIGDSHLLTSPIHIGKNVQIGSNVVIIRGTTIGDNAVIAAGSIVKGNIPANTIYLNKRNEVMINY